jgi:hypothetical protein
LFDAIVSLSTMFESSFESYIFNFLLIDASHFFCHSYLNLELNEKISLNIMTQFGNKISRELLFLCGTFLLVSVDHCRTCAL